MPFVARQKTTKDVLACSQINRYDFAYFGLKIWEDAEEAAAEYASLLLEQGMDDIWEWEIIELDDKQLRLGNVKLNNNPQRRLRWDEPGQWTVVSG